MGFRTEITLTSDDALTALDFIAEYLKDFPEPFDARDALEKLCEALSEADRIVIMSNEQGE